MQTVSSKDYEMELKNLKRKLKNNDIGFVNMSPFNTPICLGVDWFSSGDTSPDEAAKFAAEITKAAELAKSFKYNGYIIEY